MNAVTSNDYVWSIQVHGRVPDRFAGLFVFRDGPLGRYLSFDNFKLGFALLLLNMNRARIIISMTRCHKSRHFKYY